VRAEQDPDQGFHHEQTATWAWSGSRQELFWDGKYSHVDTGEFPDFVKLAEAYGATGMRFEDKTTLVDDMKRADRDGWPGCG